MGKSQEQPMAGQESHRLTFRIRNHDLKDPVRTVDVLATPEEIRQIVEKGYLVREKMFTGEGLERLRRALDEVEAKEKDIHGMGEGMNRSRNYGGLFLRHLMDKHPVFLELLKFQPILSVARALIGPQVQVRGMTARISYPNEPHQETHWHFHQRVIPDPVPPFFTRPHVIDALIYLDETNDANGPVCVLPGTHLKPDTDLPSDDWSDKPGQVVLRLSAGSCVIMHSSLWHRAFPTTPQGSRRRLLLLGYGSPWLKPSIYGEKPKNGLTEKLLKDADSETRELLGLEGYM